MKREKWDKNILKGASELKMGHKRNFMKIAKFKRCRVLVFLLVLLIMFSQVRVVLADNENVNENTIVLPIDPNNTTIQLSTVPTIQPTQPTVQPIQPIQPTPMGTPTEAPAKTPTPGPTETAGASASDSNTVAPAVVTPVAAVIPIVNHNTVTASDGSVLTSTVSGIYRVTCVPGVAFITPKNQLPGGLTVAVTDSARGDRAAQSIEDGLGILRAGGIDAVRGPEIDILGYLDGEKTVDLDTVLTAVIGIPDGFRQTGYDYAVMLVQEGGRVSFLPDRKADSEYITVSTGGFGVYVLVKAPQGSFDSFR